MQGYVEEHRLWHRKWFHNSADSMMTSRIKERQAAPASVEPKILIIMVSLTALDISLAALGLYILYKLIANKWHPAENLPPGPTALPLIGNLLDMPTSYEHLTFSKWSERWGAYYDDATPNFEIVTGTL